MGSPPRGRGKVERVPEVRPGHRITPAWAGKSAQQQVQMWVVWDHPRVGGEKFSTSWRMVPPLGSPPRGRGKAEKDTQRIIAAGITPAWAGKSPDPRSDYQRFRDHPRVGGEKPGVCYTQCAKRGSPPRGRGKGWKAQEIKGKYGITPAWAGKSRLFIGFHFFGEDHPRVGGEKHMMRLHPIFPPGSPPRGRGKD